MVSDVNLHPYSAGRHSMRAVLGERQGITKVRGTWYSVAGRRCMPIFHPSYLLRNPQKDPGSPKVKAGAG